MPGMTAARTMRGMTTTSPAAAAKRCRIEEMRGRLEPCAQERCSYWESGGAVLEGRCAFEQVVSSDSPALASWLLELRSELDEAQLLGESCQ
jgi:hypothetical protein